ncbi:hypothetical protein EVAR_36125_1 [Eumeta japonica]|uniref:Uncharacterized protein n=1 Tax=Eumeta variegata TaxID=151549 RepID=A0A4C1X2T9_EUMVA|nr:hypothetical protein EVAR_36125_1 [Eumeta japonica]
MPGPPVTSALPVSWEEIGYLMEGVGYRNSHLLDETYREIVTSCLYPARPERYVSVKISNNRVTGVTRAGCHRTSAAAAVTPAAAGGARRSTGTC